MIKRIIKYLIQGLAVAIACFLIPKNSLKIEEIALLALTAASVFCLLDTYASNVGASTRTGAGLGLGLQLVGF